MGRATRGGSLWTASAPGARTSCPATPDGEAVSVGHPYARGVDIASRIYRHMLFRCGNELRWSQGLPIVWTRSMSRRHSDVERVIKVGGIAGEGAMSGLATLRRPRRLDRLGRAGGVGQRARDAIAREQREARCTRRDASRQQSSHSLTEQARRPPTWSRRSQSRDSKGQLLAALGDLVAIRIRRDTRTTTSCCR